MCTILFIGVALFTIIAIIMSKKGDANDLWIPSVILGVIFILLPTGCTLLYNVYEYTSIKRTTNMEMAILQQENENLMEILVPAIEERTNFEKEFYKSLKPENVIVLVQAYPELKSNDLVQKKVDLLVENQKKLTNIKRRYVEAERIKSEINPICCMDSIKEIYNK